MKPFRTVTIEGRKFACGVKLITTLVVCGVRVPVIEATVEQVPDLDEADGQTNDGFFCGRTNVIYIRAGQSPTQRRDSINHEVGHAFVRLSGLSQLLAAVTAWPKGYDDFEETLVRIAAPHLGKAFV